MALDKELVREDLAKLALDRGQISQETYNRMVPPINPDAPVLEATNLLPSIDSIEQVGNAYMPGVGTIAKKAGEAISNFIPGGQNMAGMDQALAEVPLRNPSFDQAPEIPVGALSTDKPAPQSGQASQVGANPLSGLMGSFDKQKQSLLKAAEMGAQQATAESAFQQKMFDDAEKMRQDQAIIEQGRAQKLLEQQNKLEQKIEEYNKKPATIADKFANAGTGQKLLMGFAMFLGAAPNSSGQNKAVTAMQNALEADLLKAKGEIGERKTAYQEMKSLFDDERQAETATRIAYLNNAQIKLNQIAAQYKGPQILENAKLLNAKIDEEKEKLKLQFQASAQTNPAFQSADELTKNILQLPKELQKEALQEKATLDDIASQKEQLRKQWREMDEIQSVKFRAENPIQYNSLVKTFEARMFPIVKRIAGERMTDADARILIASQTPDFFDNADTRAKKLETLESSLMAMAAGRTPTLKGLGLLPKERKFSEGAPVSTKGK